MLQACFIFNHAVKTQLAEEKKSTYIRQELAERLSKYEQSFSLSPCSVSSNQAPEYRTVERPAALPNSKVAIKPIRGREGYSNL